MRDTSTACADGGNLPIADVLMVSTSYPADLGDWRGLFIRHLVDALSRRNDLRLQLWAPPGEVPANVATAANAGERRWLARLMATGGIAHHLRSGGIRALASPLRLLWSLRNAYRRSNAGLYHVNWLQNALPLPRDGRPLLATVLGSDLQLMGLPLVRNRLRQVFRKRPVVICPNAEWMVPALERAFGDVAEVRFLPFGVDPDWFRVERHLPVGKAIWVCVTRLTEGKVGDLFDWGARHFDGSQRELHLFGPMQEAMALPAWVRYHGPASPEQLRTRWFPAATGLVTLSRHAEGRPQVMLEAMAAGVPIVASRLPAHENFLQHGTTGWLCDSADGFGAGLAAVEVRGTNARLGSAARAWAKGAVGTWDDCAARYAHTYRQLLEAARS